MNPVPINLAVEDLLSEWVARRLLADSGKPYAIGAAYNHGGFGYLKKTSPGWNNAAKGIPFFLLTDLDSSPCASALRDSWMSEPLHHNFIFRVAVREVEAWVLADRVNLAKYFRVSPVKISGAPDELKDPKETLIKLASGSPLSSIRNRIVPLPRSTAKQGRDYNACLIEFVMDSWDPEAAATASPSLARCRERLRTFHPKWE